jgi:hypothetical protein
MQSSSSFGSNSTGAQRVRLRGKPPSQWPGTPPPDALEVDRQRGAARCDRQECPHRAISAWTAVDSRRPCPRRSAPSPARKWPLSRPFASVSGGGGIRTLDGPIWPITVFETIVGRLEKRPGPGVSRETGGILRSDCDRLARVLGVLGDAQRAGARVTTSGVADRRRPRSQRPGGTHPPNTRSNSWSDALPVRGRLRRRTEDRFPPLKAVPLFRTMTAGLIAGGTSSLPPGDVKSLEDAWRRFRAKRSLRYRHARDCAIHPTARRRLQLARRGCCHRSA